MYYRVVRSSGIVRVVESFEDELFEAGLTGSLGLFALSYTGQNIGALGESGGFGRALLIGVAFSSVVMLSTAFSSGIGRVARGRGRGRVIETDLKGQRYRRFQNRSFFWKLGGEWQDLPEPIQGARVVWKGLRSQTALRLGQGRNFFFATEPGEIGEEMDQRMVNAVNQELAAQGVTSSETAAPIDQRPATLRARWRDSLEYLAPIFLTFIFAAFMYSILLVSLVLDQM